MSDGDLRSHYTHTGFEQHHRLLCGDGLRGRVAPSSCRVSITVPTAWLPPPRTRQAGARVSGAHVVLDQLDDYVKDAGASVALVTGGETTRAVGAVGRAARRDASASATHSTRSRPELGATAHASLPRAGARRADGTKRARSSRSTLASPSCMRVRHEPNLRAPSTINDEPVQLEQRQQHVDGLKHEDRGQEWWRFCRMAQWSRRPRVLAQGRPS